MEGQLEGALDEKRRPKWAHAWKWCATRGRQAERNTGTLTPGTGLLRIHLERRDLGPSCAAVARPQGMKSGKKNWCGQPKAGLELTARGGQKRFMASS